MQKNNGFEGEIHTVPYCFTNDVKSQIDMVYRSFLDNLKMESFSPVREEWWKIHHLQTALLNMLADWGDKNPAEWQVIQRGINHAWVSKDPLQPALMLEQMYQLYDQAQILLHRNEDIILIGFFECYSSENKDVELELKEGENNE